MTKNLTSTLCHQCFVNIFLGLTAQQEWSLFKRKSEVTVSIADSYLNSRESDLKNSDVCPPYYPYSYGEVDIIILKIRYSGFEIWAHFEDPDFSPTFIYSLCWLTIILVLLLWRFIDNTYLFIFLSLALAWSMINLSQGLRLEF